MTRYAIFDANGFPTAFYSDDVHGPRMLPVFTTPPPTEDDPDPTPVQTGTKQNPDCTIPAEAIEISDIQWQEFLSNQGLRKWQNGQVVDYTPPPPVPITADVERERARRLAAGFDYDFQDARGVHHIGTTDKDMVGWDDVTKLANAQIALGNASATIAIITNTGPVSVTAEEWQKILVAAGTFRQPIWQASFVLEATDPIPADYAADSHWPASA